MASYFCNSSCTTIVACVLALRVVIAHLFLPINTKIHGSPAYSRKKSCGTAGLNFTGGPSPITTIIVVFLARWNFGWLWVVDTDYVYGFFIADNKTICL